MNVMNVKDAGFASAEALTVPNAFKARAEAAAAVALKHADDVDAKGRFPAEAIAMLKKQRLMGIMVPTELGGEGARISDAAEVCYTLGRACGSTGMIYAMHLVKVACIVNHGMGVEWQENILKRLHAEQLLFASSTTEGMGGGNVRSSASAIVHTDGAITLDRDASVISYGIQADGLVTTARRSETSDARPGSRGVHEGRLRALAHRRLEHAGYARHLQHGLHAEGPRRGRAGSPCCL